MGTWRKALRCSFVGPISVAQLAANGIGIILLSLEGLLSNFLGPRISDVLNNAIHPWFPIAYGGLQSFGQIVWQLPDAVVSLLLAWLFAQWLYAD